MGESGCETCNYRVTGTLTNAHNLGNKGGAIVWRYNLPWNVRIHNGYLASLLAATRTASLQLKKACGVAAS